MTEEFITIAERCHDCAFRPGTVPNQSSNTQMKAKLCVMARDPFYCHIAPPKDGVKPLCRGYVDAVEATLDKPEPDWKRDVYASLADLITDYEDAINAGKQFDIEGEIARALYQEPRPEEPK